MKKQYSDKELFTLAVQEKLGCFYRAILVYDTLCLGNLILLGDTLNIKIRRRYEKVTGKKLPQDKLDSGIEVMELYKALNK